MMQIEKKAFSLALSQFQLQSKVPLMNIIFDLSGVIFGSMPALDKTYRYGATVMSPINANVTLKLLHDCIKQGHRLFVLSNMTEDDLSYLQHHPLSARILSCFQDIILGPAVGIKKPDPRIFTYLINKHVLNPERSIFIDDQLINLEAAQKAGIGKNIHCTNFDFSEIRTQLEQYGVL